MRDLTLLTWISVRIKEGYSVTEIVQELRHEADRLENPEKYACGR
jgi:hypothetical protein